MASETERALIAAVRARPVGWDAWLVYADWLLEQGDVRGQLIAWEHQLATGALSADERTALRRGAQALEEAQREAWLAGWTPPATCELRWRYGFLIGVRLWWRPNTDPLAALGELVAHPAASLLCELKLSSRPLRADGARALAAGNLSSLTALDLVRNKLGRDGASVLAAAESLGSLAELVLEDNRIGDDGARALAASDRLRPLTTLDLRGNDIGDDSARALRESEALRGCRVLT